MTQNIIVTGSIVNVETCSPGSPTMRRAISPLDDYSMESAAVQAVCATTFTPSVVAAYTALISPPPSTLAQAQIAQLSALAGGYRNAIQQPVSFTTGAGVVKTYQADPASISNLQNTILGFQKAAATPAGFYWVSLDNTQVAFAYADLQGLAAAMLAQGWMAFQHLQTQKAAVSAATTIAQVLAVVW